MCVYTDLALKLSGLRPLAHERVENGWNVLVEFPEKRPKGKNPVYQGTFGMLAAISARGKESRLDNVRELVFFPDLKESSDGFMTGMTLDRGTHTVKGFSKFFKQAAYKEVFNSARQAKLDGGFIYREKLQDKDNDNEMMVIQKDTDGNPLETVYPLRYVLIGGTWTPQVVYNLDRNHQVNGGIPSRVEPKKLGEIISTRSADNASIAGTWNPGNGINRNPGPKGKYLYMPEYLKGPEDRVETAQLAVIEETKEAYKAHKGYRSQVEQPFNPPRIVRK